MAATTGDKARQAAVENGTSGVAHSGQPIELPAGSSPEKRASQPHPTLSAPWWSKLTFHWANPLMFDGYIKHRRVEKALKQLKKGSDPEAAAAVADPLTEDDVWPLPPDEEARAVVSRFVVEWEKELAAHGSTGGNTTLPSGLAKLASMEMELNSTIVGISNSDLPHMEADSNSTALPKTAASSATEDNKNKPSLFRAVWRTYRRQFFVAGALRLLADGCGIASPLVLRQLIIFLSASSSAYGTDTPMPEAWRGYVMALGLGLLLLVQSFAMSFTWMLSQKIGFEVKTALMTFTYRKLMKLSSGARLTFTGGNVINLVSTDATRIDRAIPEMHTLYSAPITIVIGIILLILNLGWPAVVGGAVLIFIMIPFTGKIMAQAGKLREKGVKWTDVRVKATQEAVAGIRVVKFLGWSKPVAQNIQGIRATEMKYTKSILFYRVFVGLVAMAGPIFASLAMFLSFSAAGGTFTPAVVLSSIALLELIRWPLLLLPMGLTWTVDAWVSLGRFSNLFLADEVQNLDKDKATGADSGIVKIEDKTVLEWDFVPSVETAEDLRAQNKENKQGFVWRTLTKTKNLGKTKKVTAESSDTTQRAIDEAVKFVPAAAEDGEATTPIATDSAGKFSVTLPEFTFVPGTLTTIVGPVGSGKSTLLTGIIGDVKTISGSISAAGTTAYCAQTPWIQSASIRENILFGLPYMEERFTEVLRVCGLERDLAIFPDGDHTSVGEKGLSLSGGQKARLALARAIYQDADIYVLDDILSALDSHTGAFVFENCIRGFLKSKTVILATHALHVLSSADRIICLRRGKVVETGTYQELMGDDGSGPEGSGYLARMMKEYGMAKEKEEEEEEEQEETESSEPSEAGTAKPDLSSEANKSKEDKANTTNVTANTARKQFTDEEKYSGAVSLQVWVKYFKSLGGFWILSGIVLSLCLMQVSRIMTDIWVSTIWSKGTYGLSQAAYQGIYAGLGVFQVLCVLVNGLLVAAGGARAAQEIHDNALKHVMNAPILFFDSTPTGRIMNRFSKDVEAMDSFVPDTLRFFVRMCGQAVSTMIFIVVVMPIFLAPLVPMMVVYLLISTFYRATAREVKRMEAVSRSPLYALFGETLAGLATIRAFRRNDYFLRLSEFKLDLNNKFWFAMVYTVRWLSLRLESIASGLVFLSATFSVLASQSSGSSPGLLGLAVTNAMQVTFLLNYIVELGSEIETHMISCERLLNYAEELPQEGTSSPITPPQSWPSAGAIEVKNLDMRYAPDLPLVLKNVSFNVEPGTRIGIVGRTGAGKSSVTQALFRLCEPAGGKVIIDGVDHTTLPLDELRTRLSIITQDPVLFSGTLRFNLDPFNKYSDEEIMETLKHAGNIYDLVESHPDGLKLPISEDGQSLSSGQRQLVALARTLLRRSRVVVLDEATASVDADADAAIQRTLREDERFRGTTILTIAHRLLTIIDYDKILVLSHGEVVEFGSPAELLANASGTFRHFVDQTGPEQSRVLIEMAEKAEAERKKKI